MLAGATFSENLHRGGKCQQFDRLVIRHYSCVCHCYFQELAHNNLSEKTKNKQVYEGMNHCELLEWSACVKEGRNSLSQSEKVAPPVPDRILVASYVKAGSARSPTFQSPVSTPTALSPQPLLLFSCLARYWNILPSSSTCVSQAYKVSSKVSQPPTPLS